MQTLKRTIIFLTCFVVLLSSFCFGSSAVEYDPYTGQELIYDAEEDCYYAPYNSLDFEPVQLYSLLSPNFPDFDINLLPWLEMPSYVQEIANAERIPSGKVETDYSGEYKLPFMVIIVDGTYCHIYTGYNLMVAVRYTTEEQKENATPFRYSIISRKSGIIANNAVCYRARYRISNYTLYEDWHSISPVSTGNTFNWYYNFEYDISNRDFYFYGVNGTYQDRTSEVVKLNSGQEGWFPQYVIVNNPVSGFASGTIVYDPDVWLGYIGTFTPPSAEALEQQTQLGIWDTIKSILEYIVQIPQLISDKIGAYFLSLSQAIRSFFEALGNRISGFFDSLKNYLLYFQETKPEHVNPFNDILTDIQTFFDKHMSDVTEFKNSLTSTLNNVVTYIESGSGVVNTFLTAVPVLSSFVTFFVVFCIVRKVIGR